ncbi:MAG: hypothetical protein M3N19_10615 [Candidatus Eremiobacteraeota bacterium]|nr:hypothetical protein [Candidatus Eremiobacteraeota bacterium]
MQGWYVLAVFLLFAFLMYRRIMPALLAVPLMAVLMAAVAGVPLHGIAPLPGKPLANPGLGDVVVIGSFKLAAVFVAVIFGAMLGRVTIDTGIAKSIVNFAAEFAGDRPPVVALILSLVVAVLFVSMSGLGAIIMVGSIVLPIMMTTGVPRKLAATLFLMAFALGFIFNIVNWQFYTKFFGITQQQLFQYALVLAAIDLLAMLVYAVVSFHTMRDYATWALKSPDQTGPGVPWYSLITPVLPIVLYFAFHMDAVVAFALAAMYGVLTTRPRTAIQTLAAAAIRGFEDVAPAVLLFIGIGMLLVAASAPQFSAALQPLVAHAELANPIVFVIVFGLLSPLVLYRGPLNPFGVGIAIFTVLLTAHVLPPIVLVAAIMAVVQVQNVCDPTNTANVWIGNFTGVHIEEITKRTLPYQVAVATVACIVIVSAGSRLFGVPAAFAEWIPAAAAAQIPPPGLFAPDRASMHIGVGTDRSAQAQTAAQAVIGQFNAWERVRAFASEDNPNAADCHDKPYTAFVRISSTPFQIIEGTDLDIGLELLDCGGWIINEWHEHQVFAHPPGRADVEALGAATTVRMHTWMQQYPVLAENLLGKGVSYDPLHPRPTFFYSLYKTLDGYMRVYVRPGGPAYAAGMRSNDIVDKLDGKFWWEYGTYQTQLRAYDGKAHNFDVERGTETYHVQLGEPFE